MAYSRLYIFLMSNQIFTGKKLVIPGGIVAYFTEVEYMFYRKISVPLRTTWTSPMSVVRNTSS